MSTRIAMAAFLLLPGCFAVGNARILEPERIARIVVGTSTRDEVREILGSPSNVTTTTGGFLGLGGPVEIWTYMYSRTDIDGRAFIPLVGMAIAMSEAKSRMAIFQVTFRASDGVVAGKTNSETRTGPEAGPRTESQAGPDPQ